MANIVQLKDSANAVFYPQTHEKAVVDSNGVNLQTKLQSISAPSYVVAWDGDSTPVAANIPAGVTLTYSGQTYTGSLAASSSTLNKTYLVGDNNGNFDEYVTQVNGSTYSWQYLGNTEIDLSDYATKDELNQLDQKTREYNDFSVLSKSIPFKLTGYSAGNPVAARGASSAYDSILFYCPPGTTAAYIHGLTSTVNYIYFYNNRPQIGDSPDAAPAASTRLMDANGTWIPVMQAGWCLLVFNTTGVDYTTWSIDTYAQTTADGVPYKSVEAVKDALVNYVGNAITAADTTIRGKLTRVGKITSGYNHYYVSKFAVSGGKIVFVSGRTKTDSALLAAYNSSDALLRVFEFGTNKTYALFPVLLPEDTSYIQVSDYDKDPVVYSMLDAHPYSDIVDKTKEIGADGVRRNFTSDDLCGFLYDSSQSKVVSANSTYNGFLIPLERGTLVSWEFSEHNATNVTVFSKLPTVGSNDGFLRMWTNGGNAKRYIAQSGDAYLLISVKNEYLPFYITISPSAIKEEIAGINPMRGKKVVCFGDSITELKSGGYGYVEYLARLSGASVNRVGVGATWLTGRTVVDNPSTNAEARAAFDVVNLVDAWVNDTFTKVEAANQYFLEHDEDYTYVLNVLENMAPSDVDVVTILAGTNDFSNSRAIGERDSSNTAQICGAINHIVEALLTANPRLKIFIFTPPVRWFGEDRAAEGWCDVYENNNNDTLKDYAEAIVSCAADRHICGCNLYATLGWNQWNFATFFTTDDTHPLGGFMEIAQRMFSFIISNY